MQKEYKFYVYILTNYSKGVFYVGLTNNIIRRIIEHKNGFGSKFTAKYRLNWFSPRFLNRSTSFRNDN